MNGEITIPSSLVPKLKKAIVEYLSSRRSLSREEYLFLMKLKGIRIDLVLLEEELLKLVREKDRRRVQLSWLYSTPDIVIDRVKRGEQITENITEVSILEYPPILTYRDFLGQIHLIERSDIEKALELQISLRSIGKPKGAADLLIAAICINRGEKLIARGDVFKDIALVSDLEVEVIE